MAQVKTGILFDFIESNLQQEWENMPEFHQEDLTSARRIIVHFRSDEDVDAFAKLMEQTITKGQKSIWYPYHAPRKYAHLRYIKEDKNE